MVNAQYKDATIKMFLKADERRIIRLINSIRGTNYPEDMKLSENTLETPVYMEAHNDLSFCYDGDVNLILIEHQSTINENMPLRMLMYLGRVYEKLVKQEKIYATRRIPLPAPHFIVLYNGSAEHPERQTMKLSDAFAVPNQEIELYVHAYNINYDEANMPELLEQNPDLKEYAAFIQRAKQYRVEGDDLAVAIQRAIFDFRDTEVMGPFLDENASEVLNVLMAEWDTTEYGRVQRAEGHEEGRVEGHKEGRAEAHAEHVQTLCRAIMSLMSTTGKSFEDAVAMMGLSAAQIAECRPYCQT